MCGQCKNCKVVIRDKEYNQFTKEYICDCKESENYGVYIKEEVESTQGQKETIYRVLINECKDFVRK